MGGKEFLPSETDDKKIRTMTIKDSMYYIHSQYGIGRSGDELFCETNRIMTEFYSSQVKLKDDVAEFLEYCYNNC